MQTIDSAGARLTLFGYTATPARVELHPRPLGWRLRRALVVLGAALVAAPVAFLVPPHVPWALATVAAGLFVAGRRWSERYTIGRLEGACPKCGGAIDAPGAERLRDPHAVSCGGCHHECILVVPEAVTG